MLGLGSSLLLGTLLGTGMAAREVFKGGTSRLMRSGIRGLTAGTRVARKGFGAGLRATGKALASNIAWGRGLNAGIVPGLMKASAAYGLASGLDSLRDSPYAQNMSGAANAALGLTSFGLRAYGLRTGIRGAVGSGFAAAIRMGAGPGVISAYAKTDRLLGGIFQKGSIYNFGLRQAGAALGGLAKVPFRMAIGTAYGLRSTAQLAGHMVGFGRTPLNQILAPSVRGALGMSMKNNAATKTLRWLTNKEFDAPIGHGVFALSAMGGAAAAAAVHDANAGANWSGATRPAGYGPSLPVAGQVLPGLAPAFDPSNYGAMQPAMKSHAPMGVNLTLGLHRNNNRVMP